MLRSPFWWPDIPWLRLIVIIIITGIIIIITTNIQTIVRENAKKRIEKNRTGIDFIVIDLE